MLKKENNIDLNPNIVFREEDESAFLFDPDTGRICYLNEMGVTIWKLFGKSLTKDQIIKNISSDYPETSKEQVSNDFSAFIKELKKLGFLMDKTGKKTSE